MSSKEHSEPKSPQFIWADAVSSLEETAVTDGIQKLVAGALVVRERQVLLLQRQKGDFLEGLYELPSGGREPGESIADALVRETTEETGLTILKIVRFINFFDYASGTGVRTRQFNFVVEAVGDVVLDPAEHSAALWLAPEQVASLEGRVSRETIGTIRSAFSA